jgi:adenine phosphoribosyltransferase
MDLTRYIRDIPDFPKKGIIFKDISTLWKDPGAYREAVQRIVDRFRKDKIDIVCGIEARGFILGAPVAFALKAGFVPARKPGKLPAETVSQSFDLEYGTDTLVLHKDAISPGQRVLVVDDLIATGGTAAATVSLVRKLGGIPVSFACLVELAFLKGKEKLDVPFFAVLNL